jgi:hypothetical protein
LGVLDLRTISLGENIERFVGEHLEAGGVGSQPATRMGFRICGSSRAQRTAYESCR